MMQRAVDLQLEPALNHFDLGHRQKALKRLVAEHPAAPAPQGVANMHCHTFFSFNAYGYSPTALAWLARQQGIDLCHIMCCGFVRRCWYLVWVWYSDCLNAACWTI